MVTDHGGDWSQWACGSTPNNCSQIVMPGERWAKWLDRVFPYVKYQVEVLECPSMRVKRGSQQMPAPYPRREYKVGYLMNMHAIKWNSGGSIKFADVKHAYEKVWFADSGFPRHPAEQRRRAMGQLFASLLPGRIVCQPDPTDLATTP
jgi:hypothetical protein